jgi:hypothetical protein
LFENFEVSRLPLLKVLQLDFRDSTMHAPLLDDATVRVMCERLSKFSENLWTLQLNLYCWGFRNKRLTHKSIEYLGKRYLLPMLNIYLSIKLKQFKVFQTSTD